MTDLLNCPFCGDKAMSGTTLDNAGYAMCVSNTCWGMAGYLPTEAEAVTAWNTRALSRPAVKGLEWHGWTGKQGQFVYTIDAPNRTPGWRVWGQIVDKTGHASVGGMIVTMRAADEESAKAAAQSDFEQRILSSLSPLPGGWKPIESAPKDGTPILIWKADERRVGEYLMSAYWSDDQEGFVPVGGMHKQGYFSDWAGCDQGYPTHWQPLPSPPEAE